MNAILEQINSTGKIFVEFALPMLVQSSVLILILLLTDFALRKKVRAVFRYGIWLLVLIKLVLPTSLSAPLSLGYFFGDGLAYVDISRTTTEAETMEPTQAIVSPIIYPPRIEAGRDTSAVAPTTPGAEPAIAEPVSSPAVSVTPVTWQGAVFLAWLTVVMAMGLLLLQRAFFVRGLVAQAKDANGFMADTLESCRGSMGVKRKLGLKVSANATSPAVCGLFRPVILVPQNLTSSLSKSQLRAVLLHELAHIKRGDLWVNLAQTVLQIIYFYNPLLWLANCIIRRVREQAVDEMVLVAMGEKARQYPQTLVNVAKLAFKRPALSLRLIGVVESKSALAGRIKHILNRPMPKRAKLGILGLAVVIVIAAILLPMATCIPGPPSLVIKGVVKDAQTGKPIAGARVFDDGYGPKPNWEQIKADVRSEWGAITNSAGEYSFLTWPEHHSIKVEAPGYKAERRSLYSGHFVFNKKDEEIFDFALKPEKASDSSEFKTKLPNGVTAEMPMAKANKADEDASSLPKMTFEPPEMNLKAKPTYATDEPIELYLSWADNGWVQTTDNRAPENKGKWILFLRVNGADYRQGEYPILVPRYITAGVTRRGQHFHAREAYSLDSKPERIEFPPGRYRVSYVFKDVSAARPDEPQKVVHFGDIATNEVEFDVVEGDAVSSSGFAAKLANGVMVELVGVCEHPSGGKQWWRPDGSLLEDRPYDKGNTHSGGRGSKYELAFRIVNLPDPAFGWTIKSEEITVSALSKVSKDGRDVPDIRSVVVGFKENSDKKDIGLGIAAGPWKSIGHHDTRGITTTSDGIVFQRAVQDAEGNIILNIIHNINQSEKSYRVVAIGKNGTEYKAHYLGGVSRPAQPSITETVFNNLKINDVKEFFFQTRPYEWCEFKNVSLKPNFKTDVQVEGAGGKTAKSYRKRYFATLVMTDDGVVFKGQKLTWEQVQEKLKTVPDRQITALEVAFDPAIVPDNLRGSAMLKRISQSAGFQKAAQLHQELGFEYISNVGVDRVSSRRGPVSVRFEDALRFGEQIPVALMSFEEQPLLRTTSIEFEKAGADIRAVLKAAVTSYPRKRWEIGVRLLDSQGRQFTSVVETFENSGLAVGYPVHTKEEMNFSFGQAADLANAKRFEVKLRQFTNKLAAGKTDVQVEVKGAKWTRVTTSGGKVSVIGSVDGPAVVVRKVPHPEGTSYFKIFEQHYLLEIVSNSCGQDITEAIGRKSSGGSSGPGYIQKRIGFGIPFSAKGVDGFRKMRQFRRGLRETIKEDIKETLGVMAGGGGTSDFQHLTYRADRTIGMINVFFSENDDDILQIKFVIQEVVTSKDKPDVQVEVEGESEVSKLLASLEDEKYAHTRGGIIPLVEEIGNKEPTSFLVEQLQAESRRRRCKAALVLELLGDRRGVPVIIKELNDTSYRPNTRIKSDGTEYQEGQVRQDHYYAALLLGISGDKRAVPALIEATRDEEINYQAAISLGQIGDMRAVPALRAMLEKYSNEPFVRLFAGYGLAMLNDEEGLRVVIDTLNNQELHWVDRRHAIRALGELRDKQAVPHLIVALKDDHPNIRVSAARALGAIGDASALLALEQALTDKTETKVNTPTTVSKAAAEAIAQIRAEGRKAAVQIEGEEGWGKAVNGVQCRLRTERTLWKMDEVPRFSMDLRNRGERRLQVPELPDYCLVQVDGRWFFITGYEPGKEVGLSTRVLDFLPGQQRTGIPLELSDKWETMLDSEVALGAYVRHDGIMTGPGLRSRLKLTPGKHTIRVSFIVTATGMRVGINPLALLQVVSNPVEIVILPNQKPDVQVEGEKAQSLIFHGLDLTAVPHTTNSSKLPDLFEERPLGSKSYHIQKDVTAIYSGLDGTVYFIPRRNIFYVQHDKLGSSTLTYYGPFEGNPVQVLNLQPDVQVGDKKKKPVWLALLPRSPIRSAKELYLYFWGNPLVSDQTKIDSFELEIRSAKDNVRMARINCKSMVTVNTSKGEVLQWSMFRDGLRENMIRRIGPLEDGEYLIAIHVNGIRCSNVAKFTVDSSFDSSNEPTLQVVPLVPAPGKKLQYFGLRATGPTPQDSELTNMALHFPDIIVDGVPRKILARAWSGPVYPLKPGQQHEEILLLKYYKPEINLSRKHTVKAIVGKYESAPVEIGFDHSLGLAWDEATTTIKSRPPQPPVLEGRVIGPDGKPGIGYRVRLYAGPRRNQCIEYSDKDGKYDFPNVPTGKYKLTCQPRGNSEPALTFEQFQIEANKTVVQELSLEGKYAFSGKVTYEDGSPAAGVKIVGRWEIGGGNVFRDLRVTDENGYYELTAPFELAEYICLSIFTPDGTPAQGSYEHIGVMGPRTDVDFVVKRREIHAAIWPEKFARMGGKHPDFQPVPVPEGWDYLRLLQALYKHLEIQCKARLPDCRANLKDEVIKLSFNTREYNIIRPGNAKRTGMRRNNDRGIGPEPDGLILTVHFSKTAGQFDRPYIIDRSPWTGFISQVYLPDIKLYLNVDIQYGTGINEKLLTDLCVPTSWLKTIFNNFNERTPEQEAWGDAVEKDSQPDVQVDDGSNAPISEASKENKKPPEPNEPTYDGRSLTELIAALGDQDFQTRIKAVYHLGYMGPKAKPAVPALVDALDEERLRESILHSLCNIGVGAEEAIPALIKAIAEYAPACRWMAAESLAKIGKAAVPPLKKAAGSEDIYLRIWCNAALAKQQGSDSPNLRYLAQLMKSADKRTAGEAVSALTMLGPISKPLVPNLIEALKHSVVPKKHIASALARIGKDAGPAVPELIKMLQDTDLGTRADAIYALSRIGGPDIAPAVPLLIQTLKTKDASDNAWAFVIRRRAATALGDVGYAAQEAIPHLIIALGDKHEFVRANSAKAIGDIDPTDMQAVPALLEAMKDESGRVRVAAAQTLLKIGPVNKKVILAFIEAANDNWKGVITACETFFSFLGPQHSYVIPDLIRMLKTPNERAQRLAIRALGNMGESAAPAMPYIIEGMKNSRLEAFASGVLRKLGPKAKAAVPELIKMLGDKRKRFSAASVLEAIGPEAREAIPALQDCLGDRSRVTFARALLAINPKSEKAIQQLVRVAESAYVTGQWSQQPDAHYLLVKYGHEGNNNLQSLIDALENPNSRIRLSAAAYLGNLGAEANEAAESLGKALKDDDPEVRAMAARAVLLISLKTSERKEACNILFDLLDGKDFASHDGLFMAQVRAAEALLSFGPLEEWTVPLLITKVQDGSMRTRVAAIKAFGNIGQGAKEAIPYLKRLLKAEDWRIRHFAAQAIEKIDKKADVQVED